MKLFGKRTRTVEENVERYVQVLRERTDDLLIPFNRFYKECTGENGDGDGELVILELEKRGYEVRTVERLGVIGSSAYILIRR